MRSVERCALMGRVVLHRSRDDRERDFPSVDCDGEEGAILVTVLHAKAPIVVHRALDHRLAIEGDVADAVPLLGIFRRDLEDRDDLPSHEHEPEVVPPARRRDRLVALDTHTRHLAQIFGPHHASSR